MPSETRDCRLAIVLDSWTDKGGVSAVCARYNRRAVLRPKYNVICPFRLLRSIAGQIKAERSASGTLGL